MDRLKELFPSEEIFPMLTGWAINIVIALLIYVIGKWIARIVAKTVRRMLDAQEMDSTLVNFLSNIVYAVLFTAVILASLDSLGIPVTSLLAVVGAAGLAVGLALKDSLGNFAAGVMLVMFRPFTKGDFVEVSGISGKVDEVRIFSTILTTGDNKQVIIPNGLVAADTITNYTAKDRRRVDMVFGVGYDDDLKLTRDVLTRICKEHPDVLDDPACNIFVLQLGASSVDFAVRPWAKTEDYWTVWGDIHEQAKVELEAAGLSIPYPQQDVHVHKTDNA
jgi:small conductance mechanosensitive channel